MGRKKISLRAWDRVHKEMIKDLLTFYECGAISHNNHFNCDKDGWRGYMWDSFDLDIEEYTGIEDKNDKESFIGDIVRDEHGNVFEIVKNFTFLAYLSTISFEIIGNIHENNELLKNETNPNI